MQLVSKYQPRKLADFVGLDNVRKLMRTLIAKPYSSAWLFIGASGLGKTTMAQAVVEEIGGQLYHIPSKNCDLEMVEQVISKCHYRPFTGNWNHVLVDEADKMSHAAQLAFLSKLDSTAAPPDTIFFFTANETKLLEKRFLSRCRNVLFDPADMLDAMVAFQSRIWKTEKGKPSAAPDFAKLFKVSDYNIRTTLMNLEMELMSAGSIAHLFVDPPAPNVTLIDRPSHRTSGSVDPARSDAAKRAWITIRANRARAERKRA